MRGKDPTGRWQLWIVGALALLVILGGVLLALPRIVEGLLIDRLEAAGFSNADLRVTDIGWNRAVIADLDLGRDRALTADEIVVHYAPLDLVRGQVEDLRVHGLTLTLRLGGKRPVLGSLEEPLSALGNTKSGRTKSSEAGSRLPDIHIDDSVVVLATPQGAITLPLTGEVVRQPNGPPRLSAHVTAGVTGDSGVIEAASLDLVLDGQRGTVRFRMEESNGKLTLHGDAAFEDPYGTPEGTARIDGSAAAGSALLRLLGLPSPTQGRTDFAATFSGRLQPEAWSFALDRVTVTMRNLALAGTVLNAVTLDGSATGTIDDFAGTAKVMIAAPTLATSTTHGQDLALHADTAFSFAEETLTARLRSGAIDAAELAVPDLLAVKGPVHLPLAPAEESSLAVDFAASGGLRVTYDVTAGPVALTARLRPEGPHPAPVEAGLPALALAGAWTEAEGHQATMTLTGGTLRLPGRQVAATEVVAEFAAKRRGAPIDLHLSAALAYRADPALFSPVHLVADGSLAAGRLDFTAHASAEEAGITLTARGHHDFRSGTGAAKIDLPSVTFAPDGPEPEDLIPALKGMIEQATGAAALTGTLSWAGAETDSDLRLLLRDLSFVTPQATVTRLNGVIALDDLLPLSTPPDQRLAVASIDFGLPLTDGLASFRIDPGGKLVIVSGRLHLAGGTVSVEPVILDMAAPENALRLTVENVGLRELLALASVEGLSATGRLDGTIPVRLGDDLIIEDGVLTADGPGRLSYDPANPPAALQAQGETVSLLLSALTNFQYDELRLTVDREAGGEMVVAIHIKGKNPDFYDGYPVELNFNISGKLDQVLRRGLVGYRIPDAIRKRMSAFPN